MRCDLLEGGRTNRRLRGIRPKRGRLDEKRGRHIRRWRKCDRRVAAQPSLKRERTTTAGIWLSTMGCQPARKWEVNRRGTERR